MSSSKYRNGGGYWSNLTRSASDAATAVGKTVSNNVPTKQQLIQAATTVHDKVSSAATDAATTIKEKASDVHGQVSSAATDVGTNIYKNVPDSVKTTASNAATAVGEKASALHDQVSSAATSAAIYVDDMLNERTFISKVNDRGSNELHNIFIKIQQINNNKESVKEDQLAYDIYLYLFNTIDEITSNIKFDSDIARMRFKLGIAKYLLDDYQTDIDNNPKSNGGKKRKTKKNRRKTRK